MPLLNLFTIPKAVLKDVDSFAGAGGKITFTDALNIAGRSSEALTKEQQSSLMSKFGNDSLIQNTLERKNAAKNPARLEKQIKKQLIAFEVVEEGRKAGLTPTTFDPDALTARNFFTPDRPGIVQQLSRIKDKAREQKLLGEELARKEEAAKPIVELSKFRRVGELTAEQQSALDAAMKDLFDE